ncbi:UNVERIFIED_CONTAM: hypothetical protein N8J90_00880 [Halobacillus marinus]|uniref:hypothetical protein n=1 Tax=Bacillaceae TaxID=186817 RepID=UPI0002A4DF65|nr:MULTISPECIES: hypothetical protein [Bacillaceae]ELK44339.1 hypothetical protein D479_19433 [Halobacillus sp. BAB-2008]QHT46319.1 hypothetical protein M662_07360 [Bacillus sp. SB49]
MRAEKLVKETKLTIGISLFVSLALFITWFILETTSISFPNSKAFLALSLIPLSAALTSFLKLMKIKKNPKIIVSETDERLVAEKNQADAKTLKVLQGVLFLSYLGYTFIIPEDTFKSVGWWVTLSVLLFSLFAPLIFRHIMKET